MTAWVLHVDLDQFLASVELRRHPELHGLPVIVGGSGDPTEPRKVVTCASYEAREFGVHAGMPLRTAARKCPDATFLPSDPDAYDEASEQVMGLLRDLGHPLEVWGWDEAYLGAEVSDPVELAERIRTIVAAETGLSCSVGISDNKQRAKVATGLAKPTRTRGADQAPGVYMLTDANWMSVMGDRPTDALWGVGPRPRRSSPHWASPRWPTWPPLMPRYSLPPSGPAQACGFCCWPRAVVILR
ncbi:DNA-directed DNA polymerase [Mycolicibacterium fortuitum]|uniref:DNA-directed DNA polymerase n=1 Tax=Mycolicibacterium fortuitum TaxID=1766 RepID=A0A378U9X0_MYCFO|nr:DNA-directed DNA polymerase [Mycolicibacterium fortuitum]